MLARDHPSGAPPLELVPPPGESPAASRQGERGKSKSQAKGNTKGRR